MQAIYTHYLPATNMRPSRIKATCERGSITIGYPDELSGDACHRYAVAQLINRFCAEDEKQYGTPPMDNPWRREYVTGGLSDGGCAHVYTGREPVYSAALAYLDQSSVSNRSALRQALKTVGNPVY